MLLSNSFYKSGCSGLGKVQVQVQERQQSFNFRSWKCCMPNLIHFLLPSMVHDGLSQVFPPPVVQACPSAPLLSLIIFYLLSFNFISVHYPLTYLLASYRNSSVPICWPWADHDLGLFIGHLPHASQPALSSLWLLMCRCSSALHGFSWDFWPPSSTLVVCASALNFSHFQEIFFFCPLC